MGQLGMTCMPTTAPPIHRALGLTISGTIMEVNMAKLKYSLENMDNLIEGMTCDQCDEMFQACIAEVDPDQPLGYEVCQVLWDHCKSQCNGTSSLTRTDTRQIVKQAYATALSRGK